MIRFPTMFNVSFRDPGRIALRRMLRSMVDIAREECLKQSRCKVEKYCDSMLKFGASDTDINRVTGSLVEMNNELADLLHGIELLEEKLKELKETDMEQKLLHFKEIGGILEETSSKENASAECDMDAVSKSEPKSWSDNQMQSSRRRYSFLVSQLKKSLRLVETGEFILIPSKTRGRIGRLELNQLLKKIDEIFSNKYVCQKRPPLALKNTKKQEYEKLKGRWYIALNELLVRFTSKEKISWKFALPCLLYLKRLEELRMDDNNVFIAAILYVYA
ncbi:Spindle and kinetochore-associated protein [Dirofilaria immitis]